MTLTGHRVGVALGDPDRPRWLFRNLDLDVAPGRLSVVVGANGTGKTTLLRCLAGLRPPTEGEVRLSGRPLHVIDSRHRARRIAYLPQHTPLHHDLAAREIVMLGRLPHLHRLRPPSNHDLDRVRTAMDEVGISELADRPIATLSGGERQRVMLARMLATEADVFVLDEPIAALDIGHALQFLRLCRRLAGEGKALIVALHDLVLAQRFAEAALCLGLDRAGRCRAGSPHEVLSPPVLGQAFGVDFRLDEEGALALAAAGPIDLAAASSTAATATAPARDS